MLVAKLWAILAWRFGFLRFLRLGSGSSSMTVIDPRLNEARHIIREYFARNPGVIGTVCKSHGLNARKISIWLNEKPPTKPRVVASLITLAKELRQAGAGTQRARINVELESVVVAVPPLSDARLVDVHESIEIVRRFLRSNQRTTGAVAVAFKLNPRKLSGWVAGNPPRRQVQRDQLIRLASRIKQDERSVLDLARECSERKPIRSTEPERLLETAVEQTRTAVFAHALGRAAEAFALAAKNNLGAALDMLPQIIYIGYRFSVVTTLIRVIRGTICPILRGYRKSPLPMSEVTRLSCRSQIGCALNENGTGDGAKAILLSQEIIRFRRKPSTPNWLPAQIARNQAHCIAWHKGVLHPAVECAEEALSLRSSDSNRLSVANTLCEVHIHAELYGHAWEAIRESYDSAKCALRGRKSLPEEARKSVTYLHYYGALYYGVLSRTLAVADRYSQEDRQEDLALLDRCLEGGGGNIRLGHRTAIPSRLIARLPSALTKAIEHSRRGEPNIALEAALHELDRLLRL